MKFNKELRRIKYNPGYPVKSVNETFLRFNEAKEELLIQKGSSIKYVRKIFRKTNISNVLIRTPPKWLMDKTKLVVIRLPFAPKNEKFSTRFISKLQTFTNSKFRFNIIWNTRKIQFLFNNRDKNSI